MMDSSLTSSGDAERGLASQLDGLTTLAENTAKDAKQKISAAAVAQDEAIAGIELELERARYQIEEDKGVRFGTEEATVVEAKALSPLGVLAVVKDRNMLRQQIREAAAQMVRMQRLWEIELSVARSAPIAEFAQRVVRLNTMAQKKIATTLARAAAERERLAAAERERLANQGDDAQAGMRKAMKEYEAEQQRLKRELQERQTQIDVLKNQIKLLTAEIEQVQVTARENLHFHLTELEKQLAAKAAIELETALQKLRKEMQIKAAAELDELRAALEAQHEEEMGLQRVQMEMQMQALRAELKEEARQEREAAVQEVIDHFKQSRVMSLEEQRTSLNTTFEREMATMERKLSNQNTEISTLRRTVAAHREGVEIEPQMNSTMLSTSGVSSALGDIFAANPPSPGRGNSSGWRP